MSHVVAAAIVLSVVAVACGGAGSGAAEGGGGAPSSESWARVLERFARDGGLDYAGLAAQRGDLDAFLAAIGEARPAAMSEAERIAFWVNAYNAVVAELVLELYPEIRSVKEEEGFFDRLTRRVAGEDLTLDEIEQRALALGDPRVHFAVVCASTSCPDLRPEPFVAAQLERQLEEQTRAFLADRDKGLRYEEADNVLWLSSIFKWYAGDFTGGSTVVAFFARGRLVEWLLPHLPAGLARTLEERDPSVRYLDYDWTLNDRPADPVG